VNLPQLLGPALVALLLSSFTRSVASTFYNRRAVAALSGTMILSAIPHQEPRFLLPCVPLLLTCIRPLKARPFLISWVIFNALLGFLMGVYHQGGVVPTQLAMPEIINAHQPEAETGLRANVTVFWWKTYSPPLWLLGDNSGLDAEIHTLDLMGMRGSEMIERVGSVVPSCSSSNNNKKEKNSVFLVAPRSATFLDTYTSPNDDNSLHLREQWTYANHLNLDDIDFGDDGVFGTIYRVLGRRGLTVWSVERSGCNI
jgi:GPI mannosyltransferase 4